MPGIAYGERQFVDDDSNEGQSRNFEELRDIADAIEAVVYRPHNGLERFDLCELVERLRGVMLSMSPE